MKVTEVEKLCLLNYVVGGISLLVASLIFLGAVFFDYYLPNHLLVKHNLAFGLAQWIVTGLSGLWILLSVSFLKITKYYHTYYGAE